MNPLHPAPICYDISEWIWARWQIFIPADFWSLLAAAMLSIGLLLASMAYRYWRDPKDIFP